LISITPGTGRGHHQLDVEGTVGGSSGLRCAPRGRDHLLPTIDREARGQQQTGLAKRRQERGSIGTRQRKELASEHQRLDASVAREALVAVPVLAGDHLLQIEPGLDTAEQLGL
jgi:hypothetical protein